MIHDTTVTNNRAGQRKPRPSLAEEARDLYRLASALGDSETMAIASRDMEIAMELERDPATLLLEPLPTNGFRGCLSDNRHVGTALSRTMPPVAWIDDDEEAA